MSCFYFVAFVGYLRQMKVLVFSELYWYCSAANTTILTSTLASTFLIIVMTFERCYSIVKPHKAASFNTARKAKITILSVCIFCILFNIPNLFFSEAINNRCISNKRSIPNVQIYAWLAYAISFALPFVLLLTMNCIIIFKLRERSRLSIAISKGQIQSQSEGQKMKSSEKQIYTMLLLVTFSYLILVTPMKTYSALYSSVIAPRIKTSQLYAGIFLYYHIAHKLFSTNNAINFFLYVMSGQKFRDDLLSLFRPCYKKHLTQTLTENAGL